MIVAPYVDVKRYVVRSEQGELFSFDTPAAAAAVAASLFTHGAAKEIHLFLRVDRVTLEMDQCVSKTSS